MKCYGLSCTLLNAVRCYGLSFTLLKAMKCYGLSFTLLKSMKCYGLSFTLLKAMKCSDNYNYGVLINGVVGSIQDSETQIISI